MTEPKNDLVLRIGHEELVIRQRYETLSIANDVLIALWFLVGSFMFFSEALMSVGTVLFVIGSLEMLARPLIRLIRRVHLQRMRDDDAPAGTETAFDF